MSDRFKQAMALIQNAKTRLINVERTYRVSLDEKNVDLSLQVGIKVILDNLRSALDYIAHELFDQGGSGPPGLKIYFPIAAKGSRKSDFQSLVGRNIPGLLQKRPDLVALLETFQEFSSVGNSWLPDLATLSIENKHKQLTPQKRTETERINVMMPSGSANWDPKRIGFRPGVFVGGVPINPDTQLPIPSTTQMVTREIWVSFDFADINRPVLPFLKEAIKGVEAIIENIAAKCGETI